MDWLHAYPSLTTPSHEINYDVHYFTFEGSAHRVRNPLNGHFNFQDIILNMAVWQDAHVRNQHTHAEKRTEQSNAMQ